MKSPHFVGRCASTPWVTRLFELQSNLMRSAMEMIFKSNCFAISINWGKRAMVPSSLMISMRQATGQESSESCQVHSVSGMTSPPQNALATCTQRRYVPRACEVGGACGRIRKRTDGGGTVVHGDTSGDTFPSRSTVTVKGSRGAKYSEAPAR